MGADIHGYIEYKSFDTREGVPYFVCFSSLHLNRNYNLFSVLADVRNDSGIEVKYPPRGLPPHISLNVSWEYEDGKEGYHSMSYLHVQELTEVYEVYRQIENYEASWTQSKPPQPSEPFFAERTMGKALVVTPTLNYFGRQEYRVEVGERSPNGRLPEVEAIIESMLSLNGDDPYHSRFTFWFDN